MKHYGLMLVRGDEDILDEVMRRNHRFFDAIYVLDGTEDNSQTSKIIKSYPNVEFYVRDADLPEAYTVCGDGMRGVLLDELKRRHGHEGWVTLLHSDEIFYDVDPRYVVYNVDPEGVEMVEWTSVPFFLHTSQKNSYKYDKTKSIVEQVTWAAFPGWPEIRQFKNKEGILYSKKQYMQTWPNGLGQGDLCFCTYNALRHYMYRDPAIALRVAKDRTSRGFCHYGEWVIKAGSCFVDVLPDNTLPNTVHRHFNFAANVGPNKIILNGRFGQVRPI
jgi:hypothetical protein